MLPRSRIVEQNEALLHGLLYVDGSIPGGLRWKKNGKSAGTDQGSGYWQVKIGGIKLKSSRVVWILSNGQISADKQVDHKDGKRWRNHPDNLQLLSQPTNGRGYTKLFSRNTSGFMGVSFVASRNKWQCTLKRDGVNKMLGRFNTAIDAARRYNEAVLEWAARNGEEARYLNPV